ncbi:MAG: DUF4136 domain-containing protein [Bacteroidota bacterium]|nr:DUF4136 domain-containing protein [Bacteroidota bacterium]
MLGVFLLLSGCYPNEGENIEDYDLVATTYDKNFNFSAVRTYYIIDSVVTITDQQNQGNGQSNREQNRYIIDQVISNLNTLGYTRLTTFDPNVKPDVLVTTAAWSTTNTSYYYDNWWNYWGWWGGWDPWYPGYGAGYYPYTVARAVSYSTGTVIIEMSNPNAPPTNNRFPSVWTGALNGLLVGSEANYQARVTNAINQAFSQSPYL